MDAIEVSPWYLNTRRISAATNHPIGYAAQTSVAHTTGDRAEQMSLARQLAQSMILSGKIPDLMELVKNSPAPEGRIFAALWGLFTFRGVGAAFKADERGKASKAPSFSGDIPIGATIYRATGLLHTSHVYSMSCVGYLSGKRRVFMVGWFDFSREEGAIDIAPIIIGEFTADFSPKRAFRYRWPQRSRVYPSELNCFANIATVRPPPKAQLEVLKHVPESAVKDAFAAIIGEPYVTKDWGGEKSDLYSSRLMIDKDPVSAAFLLKGPAISGTMYPTSLGKRGDQIGRLFEEPADLLVLQHWNHIDPSVIRQMEAFAVRPTDPKLYCIIDGADTFRILDTYGYLPRSA